MPQINTTITENLIETLQDTAKNSKKSFSGIVSDMIKLGLKTYEKEKQQKEPVQNDQNLQDLTSKHSEYLLRLLNINAEILRKTCGAKSKYSSDDPAVILQKIEDNVKTYIENYSKNN